MAGGPAHSTRDVADGDASDRRDDRPIPLLVGCLATFVAIFDPPSQDSEQAAATGVGFLGLIGGRGFLSLALPQR